VERVVKLNAKEDKEIGKMCFEGVFDRFSMLISKMTTWEGTLHELCTP